MESSVGTRSVRVATPAIHRTLAALIAPWADFVASARNPEVLVSEGRIPMQGSFVPPQQAVAPCKRPLAPPSNADLGVTSSSPVPGPITLGS